MVTVDISEKGRLTHNGNTAKVLSYVQKNNTISILVCYITQIQVTTRKKLSPSWLLSPKQPTKYCFYTKTKEI